jgi:hypothetical protein
MSDNVAHILERNKHFYKCGNSCLHRQGYQGRGGSRSGGDGADCVRCLPHDVTFPAVRTFPVWSGIAMVAGDIVLLAFKR